MKIGAGMTVKGAFGLFTRSSLLIFVHKFRIIVRTRPGREGESFGSTRQYFFRSLFHPPPVRASSIAVNQSINLLKSEGGFCL